VLDFVQVIKHSEAQKRPIVLNVFDYTEGKNSERNSCTPSETKAATDTCESLNLYFMI
jgi:hypothetical protein